MTPFILIVDDNPTNRKLIKIFLEKEGYACVEVKNGYEAIEQLKGKKFQLIIMDLLMPGMDGFETTNKIRSMGYTIPIIAVSAISLKQDKIRALESGCNDFLPKPVVREDLIRLIIKHIEKAELQKNDIIQNEVELQCSSSLIDFSGHHVLLVEEDKSRSAEYSELLKDSGFEVSGVSDGSAAWQILQNSKSTVDIVLSSVYCPGIDAFGLLTMSKREYPGVMIFIYTQEYDMDIFQLAVQQGVDGTSCSGETDKSGVYYDVYAEMWEC